MKKIFKYTLEQWEANLSGKSQDKKVQAEIDSFIEEAYDYDLLNYRDDAEWIDEKKQEQASTDWYYEEEDYCRFFELKDGEDEERAELVANYMNDMY